MTAGLDFTLEDAEMQNYALVPGGHLRGRRIRQLKRNIST